MSKKDIKGATKNEKSPSNKPPAAVVKEVEAAGRVPKETQEQVQAEINQGLQELIPIDETPEKPDGPGQGRLMKEWRSIAYVLRACHKYFTGFFKFTKSGKKIRPPPLPWVLIASIVFKSNGKHPGKSSLRRTILGMRDQVAQKGQFGRKTAGVGRPPIISKEQEKEIANCLMEMKKEHEGYALFSNLI